MRVELEDMIEEVKYRMDKEKSLRNRVLLGKAHDHLAEYKKIKETSI